MTPVTNCRCEYTSCRCASNLMGGWIHVFGPFQSTVSGAQTIGIVNDDELTVICHRPEPILKTPKADPKHRQYGPEPRSRFKRTGGR